MQFGLDSGMFGHTENNYDYYSTYYFALPASRIRRFGLHIQTQTERERNELFKIHFIGFCVQPVLVCVWINN